MSMRREYYSHSTHCRARSIKSPGRQWLQITSFGNQIDNMTFFSCDTTCSESLLMCNVPIQYWTMLQVMDTDKISQLFLVNAMRPNKTQKMKENL